MVAITTREVEVLALLAEGKTNAEIAEELGLAESTVKGRLAAAMSKAGARNRVEMARWWWRRDGDGAGHASDGG